MPPEKPRIAAELRIRVTSSDDLSESSFESGSDLLRTDSQPWSRPIYILSKYYSPLYEKLREERLVPDDLDAVLSTLPSTKPKYDRRHLFTLNDTFIIDFSNYASTFFVVTEQGVESLRIYGIFYDTRVMHKATPYTGAYTNYHLSILRY
jgi:hypothetical protein